MLLWQPSAERIARANLTRFQAWVEERHHPGLTDYASLYRWSVERPADFWASVWEFSGVIASRPWDVVLENADQMPGARWFSGARLNFAENLLRYRDDQPAVVSWNESGPIARLSYAELAEQVARLAAALRAAGVKVGDRVAGYLPNLPAALIGMLATTSLGAIWSSCSPDFGLEGIVDRFGQIEPKVLITADGYIYQGKQHDCLARVAQVAERIPSIERVVVVPYLAPLPNVAALRGGVLWGDFLGTGAGQPLTFEQLPFDHPVYILYSSGTTGKPKCIVHGAGGTLLQHLKELSLHTNVSRGDRLFYFTTCGWMMWNWLASGLAVGATLLLFDGSPFCPNERILFDLAERERATIFGTSAKYLAALEKALADPTGQVPPERMPKQTHNLAALQAILSTGSPLAPESFDFVYRAIKPDVCLSSISGGTDIVSCFALGNPCGPVYRGELQTRGLGMGVDVFDDDARPIVGKPGELVCTAPFPCMPVGFWNDPEGAKYRAAYFEHFPGVWRHGDWAERTAHDGMIIYGRSDATLNPGGVRIGTAEIYSLVEQLPEVLESLCVGQTWQGDVRVVLFVRLRPGIPLDEPLVKRIKGHIRANATPRHVPAKVLEVADIPRTKSGKIVELAVRDVLHGRTPKNLEALANPAALELFRDRGELTE